MRPSPARCASIRRTAAQIAGTLGRIEPARDFDVQQRLRHLFHAGRQLGQRTSAALHDAPVPVSAVTSPSPVVVRSRLRMCPEVSPPSIPPHSISLASTCRSPDRHALEFDAEAAQRQLEPEVAHDRADHRAAQRTAGLRVRGDHVQQLVTVDQPAEVIDHDDPIPVAVECDTGVGAHSGHGELQQLRLSRAATVVDVAAVGRAADRHDLGLQVRQDARRNLVGRAIGAVDHQLQPGEVRCRPGRIPAQNSW